LKNIGDQEIEKRLGEILPEAYASSERVIFQNSKNATL
jgi:hypothetical protein